MGPHTYFVYILSNARRTVLYIGVTNDLKRRLEEHRRGAGESFSNKYRTTDLLWCERFGFIHDAIAREKQLKNWHREWKWNLVRESNPEMRDLAEEVSERY